MKVNKEEVARAIYKVECEMSDITPAIFEDLPFHFQLKYKAKADNWIKAHKILSGSLTAAHRQEEGE